MLPAAHRLHRSADFAHAVRAGHRCGRPALVVHLAAASEMPGERGRPDIPLPSDVPRGRVRAGFVVSRAVGGAATRNVVTRRLRALVRDRLGALPAGSVLVVRALPPAAVTSFGELAAQLDFCLERLARHVEAATEVSP